MPKGYLKYPADQGDLCLLRKKEVVNLLNKKTKTCNKYVEKGKMKFNNVKPMLNLTLLNSILFVPDRGFNIVKPMLNLTMLNLILFIFLLFFIHLIIFSKNRYIFYFMFVYFFIFEFQFYVCKKSNRKFRKII